MLDKIAQLRQMLDESRYTVALCGSGMLEEGGLEGLKKQERAYSIEEKYGWGVEEMYTSVFYNTRPEKFFDFYKNEILRNIPRETATAGALADMERAAQAIQAMGPKGVLVKGGHAVGDAVDVLYDGQAFHHYATQRIDTKNTHGTGCTYSSAIASNLALGHPMDEAVRLAKGYVTTAIRHSLAFGQGCGPTHHFWDLYRNGLTTNADLIG